MDTYLTQEILNAEAAGDYEKLLILLERRLHDITQYDVDDLTIAHLIHDRAGALRDIGQYKRAFRDYIDSICIYEEYFGVDSPDYAAGLINFAGCYRLAGEYEKALELYNKAEDILFEKVNKTHFLVLTLLNNRALVYQDQKEWNEAEKNYKYIIDILKNDDEHAVALGTTYLNLANVYTEKKSYQDAEMNYKRSKDIYDIHLDMNHSLQAYWWQNYASFLEKTGDISKAIDAALKAQAILKDTLGKNSSLYASNQKFLSRLSELKG